VKLESVLAAAAETEVELKELQGPGSLLLQKQKSTIVNRDRLQKLFLVRLMVEPAVIAVVLAVKMMAMSC